MSSISFQTSLTSQTSYALSVKEPYLRWSRVITITRDAGYYTNTAHVSIELHRPTEISAKCFSNGALLALDGSFGLG